MKLTPKGKNPLSKKGASRDILEGYGSILDVFSHKYLNLIPKWVGKRLMQLLHWEGEDKINSNGEVLTI